MARLACEERDALAALDREQLGVGDARGAEVVDRLIVGNDDGARSDGDAVGAGEAL